MTKSALSLHQAAASNAGWKKLNKKQRAERAKKGWEMRRLKEKQKDA